MALPLILLVAALLGSGPLVILRSLSVKVPPGPPKRLHVLPPASPWVLLSKWNDQYGSVFSFSLGRVPVIVLGTLKAASDLLEKRGAIYSSRPHNVMGSEILSQGMRGVLMPYGPHWRKWRTLMQAGMGPDVALAYRELQKLESTVLLKDLLSSKLSGSYQVILKRFSTSIASYVAYGRRVESLENDSMKRLAVSDAYFQRVNQPALFRVETWPVLLKLPRFLQWFRAEPERQHAADLDLFTEMLADATKRMQAHPGSFPICTAGKALMAGNHGMSDRELAFALASPLAAGATTTAGVLEVFLLAMLLFPGKMMKAQAEIDEHVGRLRLPDFSDQKSLKYIDALVKETLRWRPILPLGIPHSLTKEDEYMGMKLEKDATVFANLHAMMADPDVFPDPDEFRPERFLNTTDSRLTNFTAVFGFGRRICVGMHVAMQSLFIATSRILWAFNIEPVCDAEGLPLLPSSDPQSFSSGMLTKPLPFEFQLEPRVDGVVALVMEELRNDGLDDVKQSGT